MSEFFVGQRVACVSAVGFVTNGPEIMPKKNTVYTIREITLSCDGRLSIRLEEIVNPKLHYLSGILECMFDANNFRPLDSRAISIFRQIAKDVTEGRKVEILA